MNRAGVLQVMLYFVRTAAITWRMAEPLFRGQSDGHAFQEIRERFAELENELRRLEWFVTPAITQSMRNAFERDMCE